MMTLELLPMLLLSLLLMASDGADAGVAHLALSGDHRLDGTSGTVIVGDARVAVPAATTVTAPLYLIGGTTRITGTVAARVTHIAGTLIIDDAADVEELRLIGGERTIDPAADVRRRTGVEPGAGARDPVRPVVPLLVTIGVLTLAGARLAHTRRRNLDNVARALERHPVVTTTIGLLLTLTTLSLFVFMAFTLVLIPVSIVGLVVGAVVAGFGVIAWGYRLGRRLPLRRPGAATAAGVVAVLVILELVGGVPIVGDVLVGVILLSGLGAVTITYLGFSEFRPAALPD